MKDKIEVISNPISLEDIKRKSETDCNEIDYNADVIFLGRLTEQKNPLQFLKVFEYVKKKINTLKGCIVGDGPLYEDVKNYIDKRDLRNSIKLYGYQENPYPILNNCKILCITSKWEGFGLVAVEAMVLGKPVVSTNVGGLSDIIDDSCGKKCSSSSQFVDEIVHLMTESEYYDYKSKNARIRAMKFDTTNEYLKKIVNIYEDEAENNEN